jgi:hypothetical protein
MSPFSFAVACMASDPMKITIEEEGKASEGWSVKITLGEQHWMAQVDQMEPEERERLRWSLEDHALQAPFETQKCDQSSTELTEYRAKLFEALQVQEHFPRSNVAPDILIEVLEGKRDSGFQQIPWEVLEDSTIWASCGIEPDRIEVRRMFVTKPIEDHGGFGNFRILYVVARPWQDRETFIDHRLVSRSLVHTLDRAGPNSVQVDLEVVRPGSWPALLEHLEGARVRHGSGHYDLIHFDMHGTVADDGGTQRQDRLQSDYCLVH